MWLVPRVVLVVGGLVWLTGAALAWDPGVPIAARKDVDPNAFSYRALDARSEADKSGAVRVRVRAVTSVPVSSEVARVAAERVAIEQYAAEPRMRALRLELYDDADAPSRGEPGLVVITWGKDGKFASDGYSIGQDFTNYHFLFEWRRPLAKPAEGGSGAAPVERVTEERDIPRGPRMSPATFVGVGVVVVVLAGGVVWRRRSRGRVLRRPASRGGGQGK